MAAPTTSNGADPTADKPPRARRWIPVSLRMFVAMLLLFTVGSILWIGVPKYREYEAIREIKALGGTFEKATHRGGPEWLWEFYDGDFFDEAGLVRVDLLYTQADDRIIEQVRRLPRIDWLSLRYTKITDAGLARLVGLDSMNSLLLDGTRVTDAGLSYVAKLPNLRWLFLAETGITDDGLEQLLSLTNLERLTLDDTRVTDAGVLRLQNLTNLKHLSVANTAVTEAGVAELRKELPWLEIER